MEQQATPQPFYGQVVHLEVEHQEEEAVPQEVEILVQQGREAV